VVVVFADVFMVAITATTRAVVDVVVTAVVVVVLDVAVMPP
jgi:hypothetical protein